MIRLFTLSLAGLLAAGLITGFEFVSDRGGVAVGANVALGDPGYGPATANLQGIALDQQVMLAQERAVNMPRAWLARAAVADAALARFHFGHRLSDLELAKSEVATATVAATGRSGPFLEMAAFAMATHDLAPAEKALGMLEQSAVLPPDAIQSEMAALRGDIAFYRGDTALALALLDRADALAPAPGTDVRRANILRFTGRAQEAKRFVEKASRAPGSRSPIALARLKMQIGIIDSARGEYASARQWFAEASRDLPGYWLSELYLAESDAIAGSGAKARRTLTRLATETGDPQIMDALAMAYRAEGDAANSRFWAAKAGPLWDERVASFPSAYAAHAAEHELAFGQPDKAVTLARTNLAARPFGEARILLANALMATGEAQEALEQLRMAERSGWRSAPLYVALSQATAMLGDSATSEEAAETARTLNPRIFDPETRLIWFAHG